MGGHATDPEASTGATSGRLERDRELDTLDGLLSDRLAGDAVLALIDWTRTVPWTTEPPHCGLDAVASPQTATS